jgi:hypothetical protein
VQIQLYKHFSLRGLYKLQLYKLKLHFSNFIEISENLGCSVYVLNYRMPILPKKIFDATTCKIFYLIENVKSSSPFFKSTYKNDNSFCRLQLQRDFVHTITFQTSDIPDTWRRNMSNKTWDLDSIWQH